MKDDQTIHTTNRNLIDLVCISDKTLIQTLIHSHTLLIRLIALLIIMLQDHQPWPLIYIHDLFLHLHLIFLLALEHQVTVHLDYPDLTLEMKVDLIVHTKVVISEATAFQSLTTERQACKVEDLIIATVHAVIIMTVHNLLDMEIHQAIIHHRPIFKDHPLQLWMDQQVE